jgi:hypothetical protein
MAPSQRSNIFKWELLGFYGGFYADMDIVFVSSVESLYEKLKESDVGFVHDGCTFELGFMYARNGGNTFFRRAYDRAIKMLPISYQSFGADSINPFYKNKTEAEQSFPDYKFYWLPMSYFYFKDYTQIPKIFETNEDLPEDTLGVHWYAAHPVAQTYNNIFTEENIFDYDSIIANAIKKVLS